MSDDCSDPAEQLFHEAVELPPADLPGFLDRACGSDAALRHEVESLLASAANVAGFLDSPPLGRLPDVLEQATVHEGQASVAWPDRSDEPLPERIGHYRIVRRIGAGGMGVVYEAEQALDMLDPALRGPSAEADGRAAPGPACQGQELPRRTVAVKVLRPGVASQQLLRRFRHEAQILGQLQHPGIAQIYEAGVGDIVYPPAPNGPPAQAGGSAPFFAMEFVRGTPLDAYASTQPLDTRQRLELVAKICDALHYAHQKGVVHRDLKPANILVADEGELRIADCELRSEQHRAATRQSAIYNPQSAIPKILDFGIARLSASDVSVTLQTDPGQLIGTIPYMSPEQVSGEGGVVDARSDVYALGVILFQLLAGRLPHDVAGRSIPEAARIIRDDEPTRLSSINTAFRGDVDTIVAKALEKDRVRRYASAAELAADIRRYLRDEPIAARPASAFYHVRKFARRNRVLVGGVLSTILALLIGLALTYRMYLQAVTSAETARRNELRSQRSAYLASLSAAAAALQSHDVATARKQLEAAPPPLRGWEWRHLTARLDDSIGVIDPVGQGPDSSVNSLAQRGGEIEAFLTETGRVVRRWSLETGRLVAESEHDFVGRQVHSPDRPVVIRALTDRIEIIDSASGQVRTHRIPDAGPARVGSTSISPSGRWLVYPLLNDASMSVEDVIRVDLATDEVEHMPARLRSHLYFWVDDEGRIFSFSSERTTLLASLSPAEHVELTEHTGNISNLALSSDGSRLVSGARDTTLRLWDARSLSRLAIGRGHSDTITALAFSPDGRFIASASLDRTVRIWDATKLEPVKVFHGHEGPVGYILFTADGTRLISASRDNTLRIWNAAVDSDPAVLRGHTSFVYAVAFSPDGKRIASAGWDRTVRLWDAQTRQPVAVLSTELGAVYDLCFVPDGTRIVACGTTLEPAKLDCRAWDLPAGRELPPISLDLWPPLRVVEPDGTHVALDWDPASRQALLWNLASGQLAHGPLVCARGDADSAPYLSRDGELLARIVPGHRSNVLMIHDRTTGRELCAVPVSWSRHLAFSPTPPDGSVKVAVPIGAASPIVSVWDARTGAHLADLRGHTEEALAVAWSPDGQRIATGGSDQTVRIGDAATYAELVQLRGHTSYVWSLAWSPDGSMLVSASGDHTVRVWDTRSPASVARDQLARD